MVKIYKQPFAHDGDAVAIPDASQPDGKMSSADGWTPDYQLPKTDPNYKPVGRQEMNGVFKEVTEALGQVQVQGSASWSVDGAPYPVNAQVYHNGKQWLALRANSVAPVEGEDWMTVGGGGQNIAVFDTAGVINWDVPSVLQSGLLKAHVTVVGGGGSGGIASMLSNLGGGGGGGGAAVGLVDLTGVASVMITVAAGGAGVAVSGEVGVSGNNGGSSSFGEFISATGGLGGVAGGPQSGGLAGSGSGGDLNLFGGDGSDGVQQSGTEPRAKGSGDGGSSFLGGAGKGGMAGGKRGRNGGGSGGSIIGFTTGNGGDGIVIVRW